MFLSDRSVCDSNETRCSRGIQCHAHTDTEVPVVRFYVSDSQSPGEACKALPLKASYADLGENRLKTRTVSFSFGAQPLAILQPLTRCEGGHACGIEPSQMQGP